VCCSLRGWLVALLRDERAKISKTLNEREKQKNSKKSNFEHTKTKEKTMSNSSSDDDDSDDDDDLFYAPSYKTRRKEREECARRDFSLEDNNNNNNNNSNNTSSSNSDDDEEDGDGIDDGKKRRQSGGEREEEERKRRCLMSDDDDEEEEEGKEKETTARVGAETKVSDSDTDGEKTESEKYNDDKLREASALMRELTKKTDARELEDDEGFVVDDDEDDDDDDDNNNNDGARVSDVNNAGDDDDNMRYEPIQLVFAFSNTNKVEFETSKRYTFERIWKDFVKEHQSKGDIAKAKLTFDGDRIKVSEDTPESLDMDDEDVIDVNA